MLCTRSRGGMHAVVESYQDAGLFERRGVRVLYTHDEGSLPRRLAIAGVAWLRFLGLLLARRVTLVHAHISMRGSFWRKTLFITLARRFGVPVVGHLHGSTFEQFAGGLPPGRRRMLVGQLEGMDRVLVLGEHWRRFVLSIAPQARVEVLPNFVVMPEAAAQPPARDDAPPQLLFLGIVGRRKGIPELLAALAGAAAEGCAATLVVGGNGEVDQARRMAQSHGIGARVQFAGWVGSDRKQQLLRDSDIYVLPSHHEGLPVSILEAMSWSLPVVSTDVGAIAEVVRDGVDGFIVPPGDVAALQRALTTLSESAELRQRMGASARQRVAQEFAREVVLPRLERIYDDVLATAPQSRQRVVQ